ncbi:uncharacterized protein RHOBADRAFT_53017, partial [Rhodotorula graminis WP1]
MAVCPRQGGRARRRPHLRPVGPRPRHRAARSCSARAHQHPRQSCHARAGAPDPRSRAGARPVPRHKSRARAQRPRPALEDCRSHRRRGGGQSGGPASSSSSGRRERRRRCRALARVGHSRSHRRLVGAVQRAACSSRVGGRKRGRREGEVGGRKGPARARHRARGGARRYGGGEAAERAVPLLAQPQGASLQLQAEQGQLERRRVGLVPRRLQQRPDQPRPRPRRGEHVCRHGARHLDSRALECRKAHLPRRRQPRGAARDAARPASEQGDPLPRRPRPQARPGRPPRDGRRARDAPHLGVARRALPALLQQPPRAWRRPRVGLQAVDADPRPRRPEPRHWRRRERLRGRLRAAEVPGPRRVDNGGREGGQGGSEEVSEQEVCAALCNSVPCLSL